jgi:3-hydroxyisobutyrate dehydrogenase-like beta-hydroxyacid dehydrogenase
MQVGFIGIGRLGKAMARNLLKGRNRVLAWDVSQSSLEEIKHDGAAVAVVANRSEFARRIRR